MNSNYEKRRLIDRKSQNTHKLVHEELISKEVILNAAVVHNFLY